MKWSYPTPTKFVGFNSLLLFLASWLLTGVSAHASSVRDDKSIYIDLDNSSPIATVIGLTSADKNTGELPFEYNPVQLKSSVSLAFNNGFENTTCWTVTSLGGMWSLIGAGSASHPLANPHSGDYMAKYNSYVSDYGSQAVLLCNIWIDIPNDATNATFKFWMYHDTAYSGGDDGVRAGVSTDGQNVTLISDWIKRYDGSTGWKQATVAIENSYAGQSIQIGFLGWSGLGNNIYLDDVTIGYLVPTIPVLAINKIGTGSGYVYSGDYSIDCGSICSASLTGEITLNASADTDSNFVGWSGDADCSDGIVTMTMDVDKSCTATFNLKVTPPTATTSNATNVTVNSATLNGSVTSNGATATVSFDFGTTTSYGTSVAATTSNVYSASAVAVSANKTGLTCGTLYHFRIKAVNSAGPSLGVDKTFTTGTCPPSPVNGVCGSANGNTVSTAPTTNLCSSGTPSVPTGTGPWNWSCAGSNGGTTATCSALALPTTFIVTPSATTTPVGATGGSFDPAIAQTVNAGTTTSFIVVPATNSGGYATNPVVTGNCPQGSWGGTWNNIWTTGPITDNCTVMFGFTAVKAWLAPTNQTVLTEQAFTLDVTAKSSTPVGSYHFTVTYDTAKLRLDTNYVDATNLCRSGICPGTSALANRIDPVIDGNTITLAANDSVGKGPGNDLQLLVIHFKSKLVADDPTFATEVKLTTTSLMTTSLANIGTGARGATVTVSNGLCGNADGSTSVNIVDALAIARKVVGLPPPPTVEDVLADVNEDGRVGITDALHIARYSIGLVTPPEVCKIGQPFQSD